MARACILGVVIYKLSHWQEFGQIVLFKVNKSPNVSLYNAVLLFRLAISLRIKSYKEFPFNAKKVTKQ